MEESISYLTRKQAQDIDAELMGAKYGYSLTQLMELAGLACAQALNKAFSPTTYPASWSVAGLEIRAEMASLPPVICSLLLQCKTLEIPVIETNISEAMRETDVILDGIFGFSFHSTPRAPFDEPIRLFNNRRPDRVHRYPFGWDVEAGNTPDQSYFSPDVLVSLTAPKLGVKAFQGRHFLGGRFVLQVSKSYNLNLPAYPAS
ncbi:hypothetical protein KEM48_003591, partial [Puccinia striiformis f. sp. tritici PST-130]